MRHLVLLGGGHAHVHVLAALAAEHLVAARVTLVSPYERQLYSGMVPGHLSGRYAIDACAIALRPWARAAGAEFIETTACGLDARTRQVQLADGRSLHYDVLSVDTGPVLDRDTIPGAREHAMFVRPIEQFVPLWERLRALAEARALGIVVVGGGAAGVELAFAIEQRLRERARVSLVCGAAGLLPGLDEGLRRRVIRRLKRQRITAFAEDCAAVHADHVVLASGMKLACEAPIIALGASAPPWLADSGLALDARGFIATGPTLQSTSHPEVFAAGDVSTRVDAPHPKSGVYAVRAGPPLAFNVRRQVAGGELQAWQPQKRALYLLSCGAGHAIGTWGGWGFEGGWVWRWKDHIDRRFIQRYSDPQAMVARR
jgi:selenide,water dikinase